MNNTAKENTPRELTLKELDMVGGGAAPVALWIALVAGYKAGEQFVKFLGI